MIRRDVTSVTCLNKQRVNWLSQSPWASADSTDRFAAHSRTRIYTPESRITWFWSAGRIREVSSSLSSPWRRPANASRAVSANSGTPPGWQFTAAAGSEEEEEEEEVSTQLTTHCCLWADQELKGRIRRWVSSVAALATWFVVILCLLAFLSLLT